MATIVTRRGTQTAEFRLYFGERRREQQQLRRLKNTTGYIRWDINTLRPNLLCLSSGSKNFFPRAGFSHAFPRAVTPISTKVKGVTTTSLKDFCYWTWGKRSYNSPCHHLSYDVQSMSTSVSPAGATKKFSNSYMGCSYTVERIIGIGFSKNSYV